jgi:phosphoesterase RecJ-like protein
LNLDRLKQREAAVRLIRASRRIAILAHVSPDGDTVGSALALAQGLRQLGKVAQVYSADPLPTNLAFLPGYGEIQVGGSLPPDLDLVVLVDASDMARFGAAYAEAIDRRAGVRVLNVDHHATNRHFGDANMVDTTAAATGEQIHWLLTALNVAIDARIATQLLTAIVTDTRSFRTPSTTPRSLALATQLFEAGAPLNLIVESVYRSRSLTTLRLWGLALERLRCVDGIAWTEVTVEMQQKVGADPSEGDGVIDLIASLHRIEAAALFKETSDGIKVSLRSTDGFDVAAVASRFGGGGHPRAAGCLLSGDLAAAEREVLEYMAQRTAVR